VGNEGERLALTRLPTGVRVVTLVSRGKSVRGRCTHSSLVLRERAPALYLPSVGGRKNTANFVSEMFSEVHPCFCSSCNSFATAKTRSMGDT
jgi:flavin reductase (DIM6/NTAB) family NADH-FMN oxidoreductase RutF